MQNILVPVGVSKYAKSTLSYAIDLASHFKCNVYVIDAFPAHSSLTILSNVNARLEIKNVQRIKKMVASITTKKDQVKIVSSERDLVGTIRSCFSRKNCRKYDQKNRSTCNYSTIRQNVYTIKKDAFSL